MIILVKYPSGELTNIGQQFIGDKVLGPEPDVCKAKPMFEFPINNKDMVSVNLLNLKVFGDLCDYHEYGGKRWAKTPKGDIIGSLTCKNYLTARCSKISDGKTGEIKCANIGVSFFNAVSCVWLENVRRYPTIEYGDLGFENVTLGG